MRNVWVKIDIKGGEIETTGSTGMESLAPVQCIMVEWRDRYRPGCLDACRSVLAAARHRTLAPGSPHAGDARTPEGGVA